MITGAGEDPDGGRGGCQALEMRGVHWEGEVRHDWEKGVRLGNPCQCQVDQVDERCRLDRRHN